MCVLFNGSFFKDAWGFVSVLRLLGLFSGCLSFVVSFFGIGICGVWLSFVGLVWNLYSACLPLDIFG